MTEWTDRLRGRVAQSPPRGDTAADQMVDVLQRACRAHGAPAEAGEALVRALSSADVGVPRERRRGVAPHRGDGRRHPGGPRPTTCGPTSSPCSATSGTRRLVVVGQRPPGLRLRSTVELERAARVLDRAARGRAAAPPARTASGRSVRSLGPGPPSTGRAACACRACRWDRAASRSCSRSTSGA